MTGVIVFVAFGGTAAVMLAVIDNAGRRRQRVVEAWLERQGWTPVRLARPGWPVSDPLWRTRFEVEALDEYGRTQRGLVSTNGRAVEVLRPFDWEVDGP